MRSPKKTIQVGTRWSGKENQGGAHRFITILADIDDGKGFKVRSANDTVQYMQRDSILSGYFESNGAPGGPEPDAVPESIDVLPDDVQATMHDIGAALGSIASILSKIDESLRGIAEAVTSA